MQGNDEELYGKVRRRELEVLTKRVSDLEGRIKVLENQKPIIIPAYPSMPNTPQYPQFPPYPSYPQYPYQPLTPVWYSVIPPNNTN